MTDFETLTAVRPIEPGLAMAEVPDGWQQGRGAFGGLVVALLVRGLSIEAADAERRLRTLTAELFAPVVVGRVALRVEVLKRSNNVTTASARLIQAGDMVAHAVGVFARRRADDRRLLGLTPPDPPPWRDVPVTVLPPGLVPTCVGRFELRNDGPLPFGGGTEARSAGFIRLRAPGPTRDDAEMAALIDAWWPAHFGLDTTPRPIATVSFTLDFVGDAGAVARDAPLYHRGQVLASHEGYVVEQRELWTPAAQCVAINTQTVALIK